MSRHKRHRWYLAWVGVKRVRRYVVCARCGRMERVRP